MIDLQTMRRIYKEKGYSEQNLVNLKKDLKSIEVNDACVYQNYVLHQGDILNVYIRETESSGQIIPQTSPGDPEPEFRMYLHPKVELDSGRKNG